MPLAELADFLVNRTAEEAFVLLVQSDNGVLAYSRVEAYRAIVLEVQRIERERVEQEVEKMCPWLKPEVLEEIIRAIRNPEGA